MQHVFWIPSLEVAEYTVTFQAMLKKDGRLQTHALGLLGAVLALVPNLDRLSLQVTGHTDGIPAIAIQTLAPTVPGPGPSSRLKTLDICCRSAGLTYSSLIHHTSGILEVAAHSLETLNLHMYGSSRLRIGEDRLHLRHLGLTQSKLSDESFGALLSACAPGLETFVYEASYPYVRLITCDSITAHVNHRQPTVLLFRHLVTFGATMKSIHLDLRCLRNIRPAFVAPSSWAQPRTMGIPLICQFFEKEVMMGSERYLWQISQTCTKHLEDPEGYLHRQRE